MTLIVWLVVVAGAFGLVILVASSLIEALSNVVKDITVKAAHFFETLFNFLGRTRFLGSLDATQDLLDLEVKLTTEDHQLERLKKYRPTDYLPKPIPEVTYEPVLPKLFKRSSSTTVKEIDVADIGSLSTMKSSPAYELLIAAYEVDQPKLPSVILPKPNLKAPDDWTPWGCSETEYEFNIPSYVGLKSPLNYFVKRSLKKAHKHLEELRARHKTAIEKAKLRNSKLEKLHHEATARFEHAKEKQTQEWDALKAKQAQRLAIFTEASKSEHEELRRHVSLVRSVGPEGLVARVEQTLKLEQFPAFLAAEFEVRFDETSKIFILEHEFPDVGSVKWVKKVSLKNGQSLKNANQREAKEAAVLLYPALSLRLACEIVRLDASDLMDAIVINGWANYTEKSTGQAKRAYCTSLFATKAQLLSINLSSADPLAAFSALKGIAGRSVELTPIAPILRLNKEDKRFVDSKEVLENMVQDENLAAMNWEDFEHLCRQLFEKAFAGSGAEVKVTQASRDQGVDAVIFDPDVIRGGKIVVQAKRYTNIVDVSAVRDLYGSVINEGATKGILVTTSHYGPDAYGFAKDKPITLLNGEELLGLLLKYGYNFRIDLAEAKRLNAEANFSR
jgi:restriction system protein